MAKVANQNAVEDFIVQINGEYNIPFESVKAPKALVAGEVFTVGEGVGIAAKDAESGEWVRAMTKGNPTTVLAGAITGSEEDIAKLAAQDILVANA